MLYQKDNRTFEERLKVGNKKEKELINILNWCGVPAKENNKKNVYDIDIKLTLDNMFVDCKLVETPFYKSMQYVGIEPSNCLAINIKHVKNYEKKEKETGKKCWIAFFIDFKDFNVHELIFIPNSQIVYLINKNPQKVIDGKFNIDKSIGRDMHSFLSYIKQLREIKNNK